MTAHAGKTNWACLWQAQLVLSFEARVGTPPRPSPPCGEGGFQCSATLNAQYPCGFPGKNG
jgi:hypothetical protein